MKRMMLQKLARMAGVMVVGAGLSAVVVQSVPLIGPGALAAKDADLAPEQLEHVNKVSDFFNGFSSLKGQFVQVGPQGNVSNGTFYISKPGKLRFEYNPPSPYLIVSDGTWVFVKNRQNDRTDHYLLASMPLELVLGDKVDLVQEARVLNVASSGGSITIILESRNPLVPGRLQIIYNEKKAEVEQWIVIDGEGRRTTVSLSELKTGEQHDASLFRVKRSRAEDDDR